MHGRRRRAFANHINVGSSGQPRNHYKAAAQSANRNNSRTNHHMNRHQQLMRIGRRIAAVLPLRFADRAPEPLPSPALDPPVGRVHFGDLRRATPISARWGWDRGQPVDRYYIEGFLDRHREDVQGRVLEVGEPKYTRQFGGDRVQRSDVLHVAEGNPVATIVGDLTSADHIPSDSFDCVILTQTLQLIFDVPAALRTLRRILKPGGVLLTTFPGITQTGDQNWRETWYWSFTTSSAQRLFTNAFGSGQFEIESHGNLLAATAFLYGLGPGDLLPHEMDLHDPAFDVIITVRATKPVE